MVNLVIVAAIFFLLLMIIAGFVSQQFSTAKQINENKRPKSLLEKMNKGVGALDTDKFRQIVMEGGPDDLDGQVESLIAEDDRTSASTGASRGKIDEMPDDLVFDENLGGSSGVLNLEGKDLQTIYSEYLSEKNVNPFDMEPEFKLGVAYLKFSQFEKAINQFKKVIDEKPDYPGIHYYMGEAYRCNGQFYEAMKAYKLSWESESTETKEAAEKAKKSNQEQSADTEENVVMDGD